MQECPKCRVRVAGNKECCPLCQGELAGEPSRDPYLQLKQGKLTRHVFLRIVSFSAVVLIILSLALNMMIVPEVWWSLLAVAAIVCLWVTVSIGISYRKKLFKNLTFQLFFITIAAVLWDVSVGWKGWSLDYVLPITCIAYMVSIWVISRFITGPRNSYIIYLLIDCIYGMVPIIFVLTGVLSLPYLSVCCVALSLISLCALLFFEGKALREEVQKKLHL